MGTDDRDLGDRCPRPWCAIAPTRLAGSRQASSITATICRSGIFSRPRAAPGRSSHGPRAAQGRSSRGNRLFEAAKPWFARVCAGPARPDLRPARSRFAPTSCPMTPTLCRPGMNRGRRQRFGAPLPRPYAFQAYRFDEESIRGVYFGGPAARLALKRRAGSRHKARRAVALADAQARRSPVLHHRKPIALFRSCRKSAISKGPSWPFG